MVRNNWLYACPFGHISYRPRNGYIYCKRCRENGREQFRYVQKLNRKTGILEKVGGDVPKTNTQNNVPREKTRGENGPNPKDINVISQEEIEQ